MSDDNHEPPPGWQQLTLGDILRDRALDLVENSSAARREYVAQAKYLAKQIAREKGCVTSEDVRAVLPIPENDEGKPVWDGRILGAVFSRHEKCWVRVGFKKKSRAISHSGPMAIWRLRE